MRIRIADSDDMPGIEALLNRSYPVLMGDVYAPEILALALPSMTRANPALIGSGTFYVAEDAGMVVGCGGYREAITFFDAESRLRDRSRRTLKPIRIRKSR